MITYRDPLFLTEKTESRLGRIKYSLKVGAGLFGIRLITLSENEDDVFDIIPASVFKQRLARRRNHEYYVVGIAESRRAAYKLVEKIIDDVYMKTGSYEGIKKAFLKDKV